MLYAFLRVLGGTLFFFILAATVGIPAGRRGPAAAEPSGTSGEPLLGTDLYCPLSSIATTAAGDPVGNRHSRGAILPPDATDQRADE